MLWFTFKQLFDTVVRRFGILGIPGRQEHHTCLASVLQDLSGSTRLEAERGGVTDALRTIALHNHLVD